MSAVRICTQASARDTYRRRLHLAERHPPSKRHKEAVSELIDAGLLFVERGFLVAEVGQVVRDSEARGSFPGQCPPLRSRET